MKKLLVLTIIAFVSSGAFAHKRDVFLGEFDEMVNRALAAQNAAQNNANNNTTPQPDKADLAYQQAAKDAYYAELLAQQQDTYDNNAQINATQHNWDLLKTNDAGASDYTLRTQLNQEFANLSTKDKVLVRNRLQGYRAKSKRDLLLAVSQYKKEVNIGTMQNETDTIIAQQKEMGLRDAAREEECVKKIQSALQTYGVVALDAIGSSWQRNCPAAANLIAYAQSQIINANGANYDNGIAANGGWYPEEHTTY